jgi:hypothetical protein
VSPYRREPIVPPDAWVFLAVGVVIGMIVTVAVGLLVR